MYRFIGKNISNSGLWAGIIFSVSIHVMALVPVSFLDSSPQVQMKYGKNSIAVSLAKEPLALKKGEIKKPIKETRNATSFGQGIETGAISKGEISPEYPYRSRILKEEGKVVVKVSISEEGSVLKSEVIKSSGFSRLDDEVLKTLQKARFNPAMKDGLSVASSVELEFEFKLNK